jgi:hypothetical protein
VRLKKFENSRIHCTVHAGSGDNERCKVKEMARISKGRYGSLLNDVM